MGAAGNALDAKGRSAARGTTDDAIAAKSLRMSGEPHFHELEPAGPVAAADREAQEGGVSRRDGYTDRIAAAIAAATPGSYSEVEIPLDAYTTSSLRSATKSRGV